MTINNMCLHCVRRWDYVLEISETNQILYCACDEEFENCYEDSDIHLKEN
jgi:hypothetical protein